MQVELVQTTTRDGVRLDGMLQRPPLPPHPQPLSLGGERGEWKVDGLCFVHGTGGNFYGSTLFDAIAARCLERGCAVLRVNTRGHDGISNAVTARGARRIGAAYEAVDDCRHDIAAWLTFLRELVGPRVGLLGHSLGAGKCLYALAHEPEMAVEGIIAISPPRLSYEWFCMSADGPLFLETYQKAEAFVQAGQPATLMEVKLPLPMVITAAGYVEKYGPDERFNFLRFVSRVRCPLLFTFGALEVASNMAFQGSTDELAMIKHPALQYVTVAEADHFYSKGRDTLVSEVDFWLASQK
jgi:pimeloyl-ACP methyl ester carboxylesterase